MTQDFSLPFVKYENCDEMTYRKPNFLIVAFTLIVSICSILVAFRVQRNSIVVSVDTDSVEIDNPKVSDLGYYLDEAEFFMAHLPSDKKVILQRIDSLNHRLYYVELTRFPSCYSYDLDNRETSVVFSGEEGFEADDMPFLVKEINDWRVVGNDIIFTAKNGVRNRRYNNDALVFYLTTDNNLLHYVDFGADAYFGDNRSFTIVKAKFLRKKFFSNDEIYELRRQVYDY